MPSPPLLPEYFDKVNFVIQAWARPCNAPWYIYIETMKPAALKAFITLITFGWDDVARGYFRPRDLGRRRSAKRRPRLPGKFPGFPEIGEEIGKRLPGADEIKGRKWSNLGETLWRLDGAIQAGLFWWLVADVTIDFAFEWTSLLYETYWCRASAKGRFSASQLVNYTVPGGPWWTLSFEHEDYEFAPPAWLVFSGTSGDNGCLVGAAYEVNQRPGQPPPTGYRSRITSDIAPFIHGSNEHIAWTAAGPNEAAMSATIPPNSTFQVQVQIFGTPFALVEHGVVTGMEN